MEMVDVLVIGGGINGAGIALDAAGRGLKVVLCDKNDFASGTSSNSSKMIHGGLRYLELGEFRLVREALKEREVLLQKAPHLITPLSLVLPHTKASRPFWLIALGLFFYDHLAISRYFKKSTRLNLKQHSAGKMLQAQFEKAFQYSDGWVDDSRLVISNVLGADALGARVLNYHKVTDIRRFSDHWEVTVYDQFKEQNVHFKTKVLINAAGPWVNQLHRLATQQQDSEIRLVKGSHIIIDKFYPGDHAYLLQNDDKRVVFVLPFQQKYLIVGTTDVAVDETELNDVKISAAESAYLVRVINNHFKMQLNEAQIKASYAGIRPLKKEMTDNLSKVSRDYEILVEYNANAAPLITIVGGKITTYRALAEKTVNHLKAFFPNLKPAWTRHVKLPGGDLNAANLNEFILKLKQDFSWLPESLLVRYAHAYGSRVYALLKDKHAMADLGREIYAGLYEREYEYLKKVEYVKTMEDVLLRRTKLGIVA